MRGMAVILQDRFRARLKEQMEAKRITQVELARRMKVSQQFVSQYLRGDACPGLDVVERFATAAEFADPMECLAPRIPQEVA